MNVTPCKILQVHVSCFTQTCVSGGARSPQSYSCECPVGTFGDDCTLHDGSLLAFNGDSYARWTLEKDIKTRLQVRLTFRTKQREAVLMDARGDRDYSTLEVSSTSHSLDV